MTVSARVRVSGPLVGHAAAFRAKLLAQGYSDLTVANHLRLMSGVSRWLAAQRLELAAFTPKEVGRFLAWRRRTHTHYLSERGLAPLLAFLRGLGVVPQEPAPAPRGSELLSRYEKYLTEERSVTSRVREGYLSVATEFIGDDDVTRLTTSDVTRFTAGAAGEPGLAGRLSALRSLLRFLFLSGRTAANLVFAVPSASRWRLASLPKALPSAEVRALLATCDRRTAVGSRNYAALLLMVRLGLRAGEVAALQLDDIDWRAGEIVVRGKGGTISALPLPADVGEALAAYLRRRRREPRHRCVFVQARAPFRPAMPGTVQTLASAALQKAGIARGGAHRLRHTAATQMLRKGASMTEIAQVLRHRHVDTTAIYAKVDRIRLRALAGPWPASRGVVLRALAQKWPGDVR